MSEQENLDIGRVVSLIMENPALIEQIANLANQQKEPHTTDTEEKNEGLPEQTEEAAVSVSEPTYSPGADLRHDRARLLGALKPYVSKERAKAIDSMISIADILDMMRSR